MPAFSISPSVSGKSTWDLAVDGALSLSTAGTWTIVPTSNLQVSAKMWGAGGGCAGQGGNGAGGGYSTGTITLASGTSYQLIVGGGGQGTTAGRTAGAGGAGTGIQFTGNSVAIIVAGGGGGAGDGTPRLGGGGGGTSGSNAESTGAGGYGGTQSAAGAGGNGGRRTGNSGSGRNGGGGNTGSAATTGGTGFGNGGVGTVNYGDAGSGGGGGGYYGGGEGGGDQGGFGGGGGSGYLHPTLVASGSMTNGQSDTNAGNYTDTQAGGAGQGGLRAGALNGTAGKIYFAPQFQDGFANTSNVTSGSTISITYYDNASSSNNANVAYTITGVTSAQIGNTALTGNFGRLGDSYILSIPTRSNFTSNSTLTISAGSYSQNVTIFSGLSARYLVVAGGAGGGSDMGGGGGAGGYLAGTGEVLSQNTAYAVVVGAGGTGAPAGISQVRGSSGTNSSVFSYTAIGGGGGASEYGNNNSPAASGGSGGGAAGSSSTTGGSGTTGQGYAGANGGGSYYPGGGGGAGGVGTNTPANGGPGVQNNILGTSYYWAGGGGGAGYSGPAGNGGLGGGGGGAPSGVGTGVAGTGGLNAGTDGEVGALNSQTNKRGGRGGTNTGSGGGGGSHYNVTNDGGAGGSGIVAIRYTGGIRATGGTITTSGSDTIHTFYSTGTFQTLQSGLSANTTSVNWGQSVLFTYIDDTLSDGANVAYTITGVSSSQINGASLTGNFVMSGGSAQVTVQTTATDVSANTLVFSAGGSSISVTVSFLTSFTGSIGASWSSNLTYTAATVGLSNNASIPYTITGANVTSQQLSNVSLSGTFTNIVPTFAGSTYFDGTGDYLTVPNGTAFQFGMGDFTIECWIKTTDGAFDIINQYASGGTNWSWLVVSGSLYWQNSNAAASLYYIALGSLTSNPTSGAWTHIAITRTSNTLKYWINGTGQSSTQVDNNNYAGGASEIRIGAGYYGDFAGNISNLRVVKGVAVYTGNFTPPTSPLTATQSSGTNISAIAAGQTSLLTCNRPTSITDTSTNAFTVTANGNVSANTEPPNTFVGNGNSSNVGSATITIATSTAPSLTAAANGFITVGGVTRSFTIRNGNSNTLYIPTSTVTTLPVNTSTSDIHSQNVEGKTLAITGVAAQRKGDTYTTTLTTPLPVNTPTSDIHSQNVEGKTLTISNISTTNVGSRLPTSIQTIIPAATFAYSSGTEISANGNAITVASVNQVWYI